MRRLRRVTRRAAGVTLVLAGAIGALLALTRLHDGPLGPLPGGALRAGALVFAPLDLAPFAAAQTLALETRPASPWSVTTWFVVHDGALYASADFLNPGKRWPFYVLEDPRVVVRLESAGDGEAVRVPCRATRVGDDATIHALRDAFARKYALAPSSLAARTTVWFFRLDPRSPGDI
jgi:hypothetical protein